MSLQHEDRFTLDQLPRHLPKVNGKPVSEKTLWRWCRVGLKRKGDGVVVRLEHLVHGKRLVSSVEAVQRFQEALLCPVPEATPTSPARVCKGAAAALAKLKAMGM